MARKRRPSAPAATSTQGWLVTFGDLLTLLITFYVLLFSMASLDSRKLKETFGFFGGALGALEKSKTPSQAQMSVAPETEKAVAEGSPGVLHQTLGQRIDLIMKFAQELAAQVRAARRSAPEGLHALDDATLDMLDGAQPVQIKRLKDRIEAKLHLGLLFRAGAPDIRPESARLLAEVAQIGAPGLTLSRVRIPTAERGATSRLFSPWTLAAWRSAALIRQLARKKAPPAGVMSRKGPPYAQLTFTLHPTRRKLEDPNGG